ncbi:MarR family winged helix-turn-helix transcriptional regulator [Lacrimispora sp.]|uniref:MarR family winged helix-turn-helix transcriptional regulator n=1 Tax=Lacrimispora sp. TaxID=2719234 RepID=UPI0028A9DDD0|nr:MarR family transcriptional regulator [Lacrimispora sp.]
MDEKEKYIKKVKTHLAVMMGKGRKVDKILLSQGLTRLELFAIQQIYEAENGDKEYKGIYVSALAKKMDIVISSASRTLNSLEKRGLISREIDPDNRRNICVMLTEKGYLVRKQCLEKVNQMVGRVVEGMGMEDMEQLIKLWNQFIDQMENAVNDMTEEINAPTD